MADRPAFTRSTRSMALSTEAMIATSQPLAALAGLDVLREGGTAADAAITAALVLGVVEPMSTGIGGDMFALYWAAGESRLYGLNGSGRAPALASREAFEARGLREMPRSGPLSVTVPGAIQGFHSLHARFGRLGWDRLFQPAVGYARDGFPVSEVIAAAWQRAEPKLRSDAVSSATFLLDGRAPRLGEVMRNPDLAATLEAIALGGADAFYRGPLAETIARAVERRGGLLTAHDLAAHRETWVEPIATGYRGHTLYELPPNGQGLAALEMAAILDQFDLATLGHNSAEALHLMIEAKRLAYADRDAYYADPEFAEVPVARLLDPAYARRQAARIRLDRAAEDVPPGLELSGDTVYVTAADRDGNMCSLIASLFEHFGSGVTADGTGVALQNRAAGFSLRPDHPNVLAPGKRPFHTIIPAMLFEGDEPVWSFGLMGGDMQAQGHVQVLANVLDFGLNPQEAGEAPRFRHISGTEVAVESGIGHDVCYRLESLGHQIVYRGGSFGGYQGIWRDRRRGVWQGGSDPRKDGLAIGY